MTACALAALTSHFGVDRATPLPRPNGKWLIACAFSLVPALTACAGSTASPQARAEMDQANDPAEPLNRKIFGVNQFVDRNALQPVARGYTAYVPRPVRGTLHNFLSNLEQPAILINDTLQGNVSRAWNTTQRFAINTTIGGAGLFDVATDWHRPAHAADFGQTLGVWGVGPGPAVQLPLFGPSNARDSVGKVVSVALNPATYLTSGAAVAVSAASTGIGVVDARAALLPATDQLQKQSLDYYATLRSVAAQRRADLVEQGKAGFVDASDTHADPSRKAQQASIAGTGQ
jgi:phospholipid-binding lipoprotein MlaA